jgi:hypothetical protein
MTRLAWVGGVALWYSACPGLQTQPCQKKKKKKKEEEDKSSLSQNNIYTLTWLWSTVSLLRATTARNHGTRSTAQDVAFCALIQIHEALGFTPSVAKKRREGNDKRKKQLERQRDGSAVKSAYRSCSGWEFSYPTPTAGGFQHRTQEAGNSSSGLPGHCTGANHLPHT